MPRLLLLVSLSSLTACTSMPEIFPRTPPVTLAAAEGGEASPTDSIEDAESIDISELDNGMVCRNQRRSGSRIEERVCYTREQYAAEQERRDEINKAYVDALDRDQRNREIAMQQMERDRRERASQMR